jgi:hypothetical protein
MSRSTKRIVAVGVGLLAVVGLGLWLWGQPAAVEPPPPPDSPAPPVEWPATTSRVPVAVTVPLDALSKQVEAALPREFPFDANADVHAYGKPTRGPISIRNLDGNRTEATTQVSGRVQVEKRIIVNVTVGVDVTGRVTAAAAPTIGKDWAIDPHLTLSATLDRAAANTPFGEIDVTGLVRGKVEELVNQEKPKVHEAVARVLAVRERVAEVWKSLHAVHRIGADPPVWLRVVPRGVVFRSLQYPADAIESGLTLTLEARVFVQNDPPAVVATPLPELGTTGERPGDVGLTIPVEVSYDVINHQLAKVVAEHGTIALSEGEHVTVTGATLKPHGDGVLVTADFRGDKGWSRRVAGRLYVTGVPVFDPKAGTLRVDNLAYTAGTRTRLTQAVAWLARDQLLEQLRAVTTVELGDELTRVTDEARARATQELAALKAQLPREVVAETAVETVTIERLAFGPQKAFAVVTATGKLAVRLR